MDSTSNYLSVLEESLDKKITILTKLTTLTEEQRELVLHPTFEETAFLEKVSQKGELIEELEKLDAGFSSLYDRVKEEIGDNKTLYRNQIKRLQTKIRMILDQSMSLERKEKSNEPLVSEQFAKLRKDTQEAKRSRSMATSYYKSMNRILDEPSFMDTKK